MKRGIYGYSVFVTGEITILNIWNYVTLESLEFLFVKFSWVIIYLTMVVLIHSSYKEISENYVLNINL